MVITAVVLDVFAVEVVDVEVDVEVVSVLMGRGAAADGLTTDHLPAIPCPRVPPAVVSFA